MLAIRTKLHQPMPSSTSQRHSTPINSIQLQPSNVGYWNQALVSNANQCQPTPTNSNQFQSSNVGHWNQALVCNTKTPPTNASQHQPTPINSNLLMLAIGTKLWYATPNSTNQCQLTPTNFSRLQTTQPSIVGHWNQAVPPNTYQHGKTPTNLNQL